jgi:multicomponent Na+:H+ antiporter subunit E
MSFSKQSVWKNFKRFVLFYALWLAITEARADLIAFGMPVCLLTVALSHAIWRRGGRRVRLTGLLRYAPGFLWRSFKGGVDIAWRVLHPRLPIAPAFVLHDCRDADETGQVLFCDVISLMPGTLGAGLSDGEAVVHLLVDEPRTRRLIDEEEDRISGVLDSEKAGRSAPS